MALEFADEVIDAMQQHGSSDSKLRPFKSFVIDVYRRERRRARADELLSFAKTILGVPDFHPEDSPNYIRYLYIKQIVETGEYKPIPPSYDDGFSSLRDELRQSSLNDKEESGRQPLKEEPRQSSKPRSAEKVGEKGAKRARTEFWTQ